jgi:hypothetical protein
VAVKVIERFPAANEELSCLEQETLINVGSALGPTIGAVGDCHSSHNMTAATAAAASNQQQHLAEATRSLTLYQQHRVLLCSTRIGGSTRAAVEIASQEMMQLSSHTSVCFHQCVCCTLILLKSIRNKFATDK